MARSVIVLLALFTVVGAGAVTANAQNPFKDLTDKLKEIPDKLKDISDKAKSQQEKTAPEPDRTTKKIDINSATLDELKTLPGIDEAYAQKIVNGRPYKGTGELEARNIVSHAVYEKIAMRITTRSETQAGAGRQSHRTAGGPTGGPNGSEECKGARRAKGMCKGSQSPSAASEVGSADFAALRKAADRVAAGVHNGLKLWRVDLRAWARDGSLKIVDGTFYYFLIVGQLPTDHDWVSAKDVSLVRVDTKNRPGMQSPEASRDLGDIEMMVDRWQLVPVPSTVRSPEQIIMGLNRSLGPDPADDRAPFRLRLVYVGNELGTSPRYKTHSPLENLGARGFEAPLFVKTAPRAAWIWWTVVEQSRSDPAASAKQAGAPRRVSEFIYVNAMTGEATSRCKGAGPTEIPC